MLTFKRKILLQNECYHMSDLKNLFEAVLRGRWEAQHAEVADETRSHRVTTSTGWCTGCGYSHIL